MVLLFIIAAIVLARSYLLRSLDLPSAFKRRVFPASTVWLGAILLPAGYAALLAIVRYTSDHDRDASKAWLASLPFRLAFHGPAIGSTSHVFIEIGALLSVAVQTAGLILLAYGAKDRFNRFAPYVVGGALALLSVTSSVLSSSDVLYYAYTGTVGLESYGLTSVTPGSPYAILLPNVPLVGNIYGPLWTIVDRFAVGSSHSIYEAVVRLRFTSVVFFVCTAATIRWMRFKRPEQIAFALNPMLWFYFVLNAHNDVMALSCCFVAIAIVRRYPQLAVVAIALAASIKISYVVFGCCALARLRSRRRIVLAAVSTFALTLGLAFALGGERYFANVTGFVHGHVDSDPSDIRLIRIAMVGIIVFVTAASVLTRRFVPSGAWLFPLASPSAYPWYLAWGLPFAVVARRGFGATLLLLPIGATLGDFIFRMNAVTSIVTGLAIVLILSDTIVRLLAASRTRVPVRV